MAKTKSSLMNAMKKSKEKQAGKEVQYGGVDMPPVDHAVAVLNRGEIKQYESGPNKGKFFLQLGGTCISPEKNPKGDRTKGLMVFQRFDLFETKWPDGSTTSEEDNVDKAINEIRKIAAEDFDNFDGTSEEFLAVLVEARPKFKFSVREYMGQKYVNGRPARDSEGNPVKETKTRTVFEGSEGIDDEDFEEEDGIEEEEVDEEQEEEQEQEEQEESEGEEEVDILALGELAQEGDSESEDRLIEMCDEAGIDYNEIETWTEVAELLVSEESEEEPDPSQPVIGDKYKYKNKQGKVATYKVVDVDLEKETVKLKALKGPGQAANVSWSNLMEA